MKNRRFEGLKICMECGEVIEIKEIFKHNKKHPKKLVVGYKQLYESDLK